jgi:hypothetical protein
MPVKLISTVTSGSEAAASLATSIAKRNSPTIPKCLMLRSPQLGTGPSFSEDTVRGGGGYQTTADALKPAGWYAMKDSAEREEVCR